MTWVLRNLASFCLETVLLSVQDRCMICARHTIGSKSHWTDSMVPLGGELMWKLVSVRLEIVLIFTQDRCPVCVERTIGSEIIIDAPNGTPM